VCIVVIRSTAVVTAEAVTAAAVITNCKENDKGDYDEPNGRILEEFAKAVHMIHPFINNSL